MSHFESRKKTFDPLVFVGSGNFLHILADSRCKSIRVGEVFVTCGKSYFRGGLVLGAKGDTLPVLQDIVANTGNDRILVQAVVIIDEEVELPRQRSQ